MNARFALAGFSAVFALMMFVSYSNSVDGVDWQLGAIRTAKLIGLLVVAGFVSKLGTVIIGRLRAPPRAK